MGATETKVIHITEDNLLYEGDVTKLGENKR